MKLASLLNPELIFFGIPGSTREEIYNTLAARMAEHMSLPFERETLVADLMAREDQIHVSYERGFAFPHVRYSTLSDLNLVVGVLDSPVMLTAWDKTPTRLILCSMISPNTSVIYLKALAAFSKLFINDPAALDALAASGSPEAFICWLNSHDVEALPALEADDVMRREPLVLPPDAPISKAIDIFSTDCGSEIPVVDGNGRLLGALSAEMILRKAVPDYVMMLNNLNFLPHFEPFETLLKEEGDTRVDAVMKPAGPVTITPRTPLMQLTVKLLKEKENTLFVAENGILLGVISYIDLISKILRA